MVRTAGRLIILAAAIAVLAVASRRLPEGMLRGLVDGLCAPADDVYVVREGDSLSAIGARLGIPVATLVAANADRYPSLRTDPSLIGVGWELLLPDDPDAATTASGEEASTVHGAYAGADGVGQAVAYLESAASASPTGSAPDVAELRAAAEQSLAAVNLARAERGVPALRWDESMYVVTAGTAEYLAAHHLFGHYLPETPARRVCVTINASSEQWAENAAARSAMAEIAACDWHSSSAHFAIATDPRYTRAAAAVAVMTEWVRFYSPPGSVLGERDEVRDLHAPLYVLVMHFAS